MACMLNVMYVCTFMCTTHDMCVHRYMCVLPRTCTRRARVVQGLARVVQGSLAFFREKYCISASNRKDNILFKAKSSLFGSYILKKSAGNTLDKISYNYRY